MAGRVERLLHTGAIDSETKLKLILKLRQGRHKRYLQKLQEEYGDTQNFEKQSEPTQRKKPKQTRKRKQLLNSYNENVSLLNETTYPNLQQLLKDNKSQRTNISGRVGQMTRQQFRKSTTDYYSDLTEQLTFAKGIDCTPQPQLLPQSKQTKPRAVSAFGKHSR